MRNKKGFGKKIVFRSQYAPSDMDDAVPCIDETSYLCSQCGRVTHEPEYLETIDGIERAFCSNDCYIDFVESDS